MLESPATDPGRAAACAHCGRTLTAAELEFYGNGCERCETELHHAMQDDRAAVLPPLEQVAVDAWRDRAIAAEAEAAQLRARLHEAEKGAEAMDWSTDWSVAERHEGDILAGAYSSQGGWRQAVVGYAAGIFWDWPFGEQPTHWRHLDKPPALTPAPEATQEAGDGR